MTARPISPAQIRFLSSLLTERGLPTEGVENYDMRKAGQEIDRVKALPRPRATHTGAPDLSGVPVSKFMIIVNDRKIHLEVVERRGGRRYMNLLIGAPGDWRHERLSWAKINQYVAHILADSYVDPVSGDTLTGASASAVRFSREHKCCAACMSPLSDETQPGYVRGLGPVCVKRF